MIDFRIARALVSAELRAAGDDRLAIDDGATQLHAFGWVFVCTPQVDDDRPAPAFLVNRDTGELLSAGSAWPIQKYVDDYETELKSRTGTRGRHARR